MSSNPKIELIIGLGNPGRDYENAYHNAGFLFVSYLKENQQIFNFSPYGRSSEGRQFSIFKILKSDTYMNESGQFVRKAVKKFGAKPENLMIAHDDSDIALGNFKLSFGRGSAGHKGVESIVRALGNNKFWRLRIGVRQIGRKSARLKAGEFVLKKISSADKKALEEVFERVGARLLSHRDPKNPNTSELSENKFGSFGCNSGHSDR